MSNVINLTQTESLDEKKGQLLSNIRETTNEMAKMVDSFINALGNVPGVIQEDLTNKAELLREGIASTLAGAKILNGLPPTNELISFLELVEKEVRATKESLTASAALYE